MAVRKAMASQLRLAAVTVTNSKWTRDSLCEVLPALRPRMRLVYNGVDAPDQPVMPPRLRPGAVRAVVVGRLSPRKAPHVALEAVALLRAGGLDATLEVCGTPVPGQEAYEEELRRRAARPDLDAAVTFSGYTSPVWPALARADVLPRALHGGGLGQRRRGGAVGLPAGRGDHGRGSPRDCAAGEDRPAGPRRRPRRHGRRRTTAG